MSNDSNDSNDSTHDVSLDIAQSSARMKAQEYHIDVGDTCNSELRPRLQVVPHGTGWAAMQRQQLKPPFSRIHARRCSC